MATFEHGWLGAVNFDAFGLDHNQQGINALDLRNKLLWVFFRVFGGSIAPIEVTSMEGGRLQCAPVCDSASIVFAATGVLAKTQLPASRGDETQH